MGVVTLTATADNEISSGDPTNNHNSQTYFNVGNAFGATYRGLVRFDISSIPAGATIDSVTLRLYDTGDDFSSNDRTVEVHRMLQVWTEAGVTWNKYDGTTNWGTAGAGSSGTDYEATVIGSFTQPNAVSAGYKDITLSTASVQGWLDGNLTNNGIGIYSQTETDDAHSYQARTEANPPKLVVNYTANSASLSPSSSTSKSLSPSASTSPSGSFSPSASASFSSSPSSSLSPSASNSASASRSTSSSASPSLSPSASPSLPTYVDKYSSSSNTYTDKYSAGSNTYSDKYLVTGNTYTNKYNEF